VNNVRYITATHRLRCGRFDSPWGTPCEGFPLF